MDKNSKVGYDDYHVHTDVTDGKVSAEKIIKAAEELNMRAVAFTEHISIQPTYDWFKFREKIEAMKGSTKVKIFVGVEAKVLNSTGKLNVNEDVMSAADLVLGAVHGEGRIEWLMNSDCDVIAHPQITARNVDDFIDCKKVLEINPKYPLKHEILERLIQTNRNRFSFGSNTHSLRDLKAGQKYFAQIMAKYGTVNIMKL